MQFLRQVPILASLSDMEVMAVADTLGVEEFKEQAVICSEGEVGDKFYIIEVSCVLLACGNRACGFGLMNPCVLITLVQFPICKV